MARVADLRVDYIDRPLGLENRRPRFSWTVEGEGRDLRQAAYRIQVAGDEAALGTGDWLWDSGRIASSRSLDLLYDGPDLASRQRCVWRVSLWLAADGEPIPSQPSGFEMGLLEADDWSAAWIAAPTPQGDDGKTPLPAALMRRRFTCAGPVVAARLYVTALGAYEISLNGQGVGDARLAPESTDFRRRGLYQIHDVTHLIGPDENVIAALLGDGWYGSAFGWKNERGIFGAPPNRLRAQLELTYADGGRETVSTDADWRTAASAILSSEIYDGEVYDARLERAGWSEVDFDDSAWAPVVLPETLDLPLAAQVSPPIRQTEILRAKTVTETDPGVFVFDFGQNFAGWARLHAEGPTGTTVRLRFAEILGEDGRISVENLRGAKAADSFILAGGGPETFEPRFTYHGFRYVEVSGYPGRPSPEALDGVVAHSDCAITGALDIADPTLAQVWRNSVWSQRSNLFGVPTDCPQRDERLGWMGDAQVFWDAASYTMDVDAFTRRFMGDVRVAQRRTGGFPDVTPYELRWDGSPGWADAGVILPWTLYRKYADTGVIDENWEAMERWLAWLAANNPDHIWRNKRGVDYGDWLAVDAVKPGDPTSPKDLIATAFWAYDAALMAEMATATGRTVEAATCAALRETIARAFVDEFVRADGGIGNDSQTSHVLALRFGLVPEALRAASVARLATDIEKRGGKLSTGFLGTPYILDALADNGREDVAVGLLLQTEFPSWGYMVAKGATSMWERWNGDTGDVSMNSFNHYAYGAVTGFLYRRLAGIAPAAPGFDVVEIRPLDDARIDHGGGRYVSAKGPISTAWRRAADGGFSLDVTLPPNSTGRLVLPARTGQQLFEDGRPFDGAIVRGNGRLRAETGSGAYRFEVR
ncbi:MAG TPA: family 78 glycoside hydrolase catalytic domain [Caulobacteraceae bacterium]